MNNQRVGVVNQVVNRSSPLIRVMMVFTLIMLVLSGFGNRTAQAQIATEPLFLAPPVAPNIMFIQDDSGSMMFEILPDDDVYFNTSGPPYVFPPASGIYGSSDYSSTNSATTNNSGTNKNVATLPTTTTTTAGTTTHSPVYGAIVRSSYWNTLYYNPAITYTPWTKADKTLYPAANLTCAPHNPYNTGKGCRNITSNISDTATWRNCNSSGSCSGTTTLPNSAFWAATYFIYDTTKGTAGKWTSSNYTRVEIKSATASYSGEGRTSRTDCTGGICTYAEEIQNFANWYTYYRSRILASRAGIGSAFAKQPVWISDAASKMRVGFGTINTTGQTVDGQATDVVIKGVRPFWGTNRNDFYTTLYSTPVPAQGTPLLYALDETGQYYSRTDGKGPWSKTPGTTSTEFASCRQSYTILMTDGYWNGAGASIATGNVDKINGPLITGPTAADGSTPSFQYSPTRAFNAAKPGYQGVPFSSAYDASDTLADVAMYYWNHDLHGTLANRVPTNTKDLAFWQHMVTFGVGLGVKGSIANPDTAFDAINTGATISWADPSTNPGKIDDLLHAAVNSRGGFFSAADPNTFANKLADVLDSINALQDSSSSALSASSTKLTTNTLLFEAGFQNKGQDWTGELSAYALNPTSGSVSATPTWTTDTAGKIPAAASRNIFTAMSNTSADKVAFNWSALNSTQQNTLSTTYGITQAVMNWVRGDQSNEKPTGTFRKRSKLLGDIVNSSPAYVGAPLNFGYGTLAGYDTFRTAKKNRAPMVYIGANDGMLHAFDALTGVEKFAYLPKASYDNLAKLSDPEYAHRYFVDGSPYITEALVAGSWKSILIGTMGAGGRSVFALDVTEPVSSTGTVTFNATNILWEFTDTDLGYTIGQPTIGRLQNGTWVVVFGNGYYSTNYSAYLYVVNLETGALIAKIKGTSGTDSSTSPNGLAAPALLGDTSHNLVAAYAGDLKGNVWKFDLTGTLSNSTTPAFSGTPLFKAIDINGNPQPITAPLEIGKHPQGGYLIFFGTGKYFDKTDNQEEASPAIRNSFYGIWDQAILSGSNTWTGGSAITVTNTTRSTVLLEQTILEVVTNTGYNWRVLSKNPITWTGAGAKRGWYIDLSAQSAKAADGSQSLSERVIDTPILDNWRVFFSTRIQNINAQDPCDPLTGTGWLMAVDMLTGGRKDDVFDVNGNGTVDSSDLVTSTVAGGGSASNVSASGLGSKVGMPRVPTLLPGSGLIKIYLPGQSGIQQAGAGGGANPSSRLSWRQLW